MPTIENPFAVFTWRCSRPGCTSVKRESNHWYIVITSGPGLGSSYLRVATDRPIIGAPYPWREFHTNAPGLAFYCWDDRLLEVPGARPVCGVECACIMLARIGEL